MGKGDSSQLEFEQIVDDFRRRGVYGDAVEALDLGYHEQALEFLLERARTEDDSETADEIRRFMVAIFESLGPDHPLSQRYRRQLASALY